MMSFILRDECVSKAVLALADTLGVDSASINRSKAAQFLPIYTSNSSLLLRCIDRSCQSPLALQVGNSISKGGTNPKLGSLKAAVIPLVHLFIVLQKPPALIVDNCNHFSNNKCFLSSFGTCMVGFNFWLNQCAKILVSWMLEVDRPLTTLDIFGSGKNVHFAVFACLRQY